MKNLLRKIKQQLSTLGGRLSRPFQRKAFRPNSGSLRKFPTNHNTSKGIQNKGVGGTTLQVNEIIGISEQGTEMRIRDFCNTDEFNRNLKDYQYCKLEGLQIMGFPDQGPTQIFCKVSWQMTFSGDPIHDDSSKIFTYPCYTKQVYRFRPPNIQSEMFASLSDAISINPSKWILTNMMQTAIINDRYPLGIWMWNLQSSINEKFQITTFWKFRYRTSVYEGTTLYSFKRISQKKGDNQIIADVDKCD